MGYCLFVHVSTPLSSGFVYSLLLLHVGPSILPKIVTVRDKVLIVQIDMISINIGDKMKLTNNVVNNLSQPCLFCPIVGHVSVLLLNNQPVYGGLLF